MILQAGIVHGIVKQLFNGQQQRGYRPDLLAVIHVFPSSEAVSENTVSGCGLIQYQCLNGTSAALPEG